jgi:hypothetical protein
VSVTDAFSSTGTGQGTANVADAPVAARGGFTVTALATVLSATQTVATFTDPGGPEALGDYSAMINWGDNTTPTAGTISFNSGTGVFSVQGSHTYDQAGTDTITVMIHHDTAADVMVTSTAQVSALLIHFAVAGFPSPVVAGTPGNFTVTALDQTGALVPGYRGTVHFTSSDAQAMLPADYPFTAADAGMHPFSATLKTAGPQSITATDAAMATFTGTQSGIVVNPAAASSFVVSGYPSPTTAGRSGRVTVSARDPYGNVATGYRGTAHFTSSDAQAILPTDYPFAASDNGTHTFDAAFLTAGTQSLTATDTMTAGLTGAQSGIVVTGAAASTLVVSGFPSPVAAGQSATFTVTARDRFGNTATGYAGTVHFTSSDGQAVLPGDATLTNGTGTFSATLETAGTQSLTATDTATAGLTGTQSGIVVTAGAVTALAVTGLSITVSGNEAGFRVVAQDAYGNTVPGYRGTVHISSSDPLAYLPLDYTFTAADAGQHDFGALLVTVGTDALTAADTATSGLSGTASVLVTPAYFTVTGPDSVTAGQPATLEATAYDAYGDVATGYRGRVHFTSSDGQATVPADYAFTAADAGVHDFTVTLKTAGYQTVTVADTVTPAASAGIGFVLVNPAAATTLSVSGYPSPSVAGTGGSVLVTALDPYGNVATGYTGTVHLTSTDPQAYLDPDHSYAAADYGQHYFYAVLVTAGTHSITATDTATASITGAQSGLVVTPADAAYFIVDGFPSPTTAGAPGTFTVSAIDAYNNLATGYQGTVHFTSSDGAASLPADYPFTAADQGRHSFTATLRTLGLQSLTATDLASGATGTQDDILVMSPPSAAGAGRQAPAAAGAGRERLPAALGAAGLPWAEAIDALLAGLRGKRQGWAAGGEPGASATGGGEPGASATGGGEPGA